MGLGVFDIVCTNDCDEVLLPALPEDPFCVPAPVLSEVNSIILTRVGGTNPIDWTVSPAEAVADTIDNTNDDNTKSRQLVVSGEIPDHEPAIYVGPNFQESVVRRTETASLSIPVSDDNYNFLRNLQCSKVPSQWYFQYTTYGGKIFGGENGIPINGLDVFFPKTRGLDGYEIARLTIKFEYVVAPQRSDNPLATTSGVGGV